VIRFSFKKGLIFVEINTRWQLVRRLATGKLQFENEAGEIKTLTDGELYRLWLKGIWNIDLDSIGSQSDIIYYATPRDLSTFPEKWQKRARIRYHYISYIDPAVNKYNPERWKALINEAAKKINDPRPPAPSSVQIWWRRYRVTKSILSLIPRSITGFDRGHDPRYAIFEEVLAEIYLTPQKLPMADVVRAVQSRIAQLNQSRDPAQQIKPLSRSVIYTWLSQLRQDVVDAARLGANVARSKYRVAMGGLKVDGLLERVEIDHTPLDIIVIDKVTKIPLGRPWMTMAIERYSRLIYSFYISFNAPSSYSVLQCLKRGILPKDEWLARYPGIQNVWPAHGIPTLVAVDNGMDLHSEAFEKSCDELGIQILYCPAANPEAKGSIERSFRTLAKDLIHKLPGTVFSNIEERGDYAAEELAAIDLDTLLHLVTKWVVDVYNVSFHRGIKTTPLLKWMQAAPSTHFELPADPRQMDVIIGIPAKRTVFHYGIELEGLHYNGRALQDIRRRAGENLQVQLKFYVDTVAYIDVFDQYANEYVRVECVHQDYAEGLQRDSHRLVREYARRQYGDHYSQPQLMEAREYIASIVAGAVQDKKMSVRKKAAGLARHDSESILTKKSALDLAQEPLLSAAAPVPEELPDGLLDELPYLQKLNLPSLDLNDPDTESPHGTD